MKILRKKYPTNLKNLPHNFLYQLQCIYLVIKYPFLCTRNRFTDKHYNCWEIIKFHRKWWKHTEDCFFLHFVKEFPEGCDKYVCDFDGSREYRIDFDNEKDMLSIYDIMNRKTIYSSKISDFGTGKILKTRWKNQTPYILVEEGWKDKENVSHFVLYTHAKWLKNIIKFFDFINDYILQIFHIIPTYTELEAMPWGWRKTFGLQMCKEIKQALLKAGGRKALRKYRIMQIKEKFGGLRWYDSYSNKEVWDIIGKYEQISYKICIECGKPATCISTGWISPYCDDCKKNDRDYVPITKDNAWDKAYSYYWSKEE